MHHKSFAQLAALAVALAGHTGTGFSAAESNPLKDVLRGDWIAYRVTVAGKAKTTEKNETVSILFTYVVTEKDEKSVTVKTEQKTGDQLKTSEKKISLDKSFDLLSGKEGEDPRVKIVEKGKEVLKLNGNEYACRWVKKEAQWDLQTSVSVGGRKDVRTVHNKIESQDWVAPQVAFGGVVKRTVKMNADTTVEYQLQDQGKAK